MSFEPIILGLNSSGVARCFVANILSYRNTFPIPEIIFDPTLVLSPYVFLLGMLFRIQGFKNFSEDGLVVDCPENLYKLGVLDGLGQQELKLKDEILN
ncbi:hypothetical protein BDW67DRAFT_171238 [Aspergillus spinulosporus]